LEIIQHSPKTARIVPEDNIIITNAGELKETLISLINQGVTEITIDFAQVQTIDSSGLGKLLLGQKMLREKDGQLVIENVVSEYIQKMFRMIHLDKIIEIR
jgi:anti-sigma B factor antagonist